MTNSIAMKLVITKTRDGTRKFVFLLMTFDYQAGVEDKSDFFFSVDNESEGNEDIRELALLWMLNSQRSYRMEFQGKNDDAFVLVFEKILWIGVDFSQLLAMDNWLFRGDNGGSL